MLLLDPRGALHLHDGESGRRTLQDVHRHEHGVGTKGRLVDDLRAASQRLLGSGEALRVGPIRQVDEDPAGNIGARRRAHPRAIVEERLGEIVRQKLWRFRLVHGPPQPLVALQARHHTRFGETDRSGWHGASIGQPSICRNAPRDRTGPQKKFQGIALIALPFFRMTTRGLAPSVAALAVVLSLASPARAASPTQTLQGFFGNANAILATVDPMRSLDEPRRAVRELVDQVFDYQEAAELVLGPVWQTRTPDQRTEFVRLFADFLERGFVAMIGSKASVSSGVSVQYVGESVEGDAATVSTTVLTRNGGEMPVDYSMIRGAWGCLVRDVIIEGVSLIPTYRAQFARVIRASSYAALIAKMRGDSDEAPRERRWVVTVETTPVAPAPVVPHLLASAPATPLPVAVIAPPVAPAPVPRAPISASPPKRLAGSAEEPPVAVAPPPPAVARNEPPARASMLAITSYWVQVGAFKTAEAAARVTAELRRAGHTAWNGALTTLSGSSEPALVRVRVGPFTSRADAQAKLHELVTRGYTPFIATDVHH